LIHRTKKILFQQAGEKLLRQILCIMGAFPLPANESVKWKPVNPAELFQRWFRQGEIPFAGSGQDDAPLRLAEVCPTREVAPAA
jgi:hypothetical protein